MGSGRRGGGRQQRACKWSAPAGTGTAANLRRGMRNCRIRVTGIRVICQCARGIVADLPHLRAQRPTRTVGRLGLRLCPGRLRLRVAAGAAARRRGGPPPGRRPGARARGGGSNLTGKLNLPVGPGGRVKGNLNMPDSDVICHSVRQRAFKFRVPLHWHTARAVNLKERVDELGA